MHVPSLEITSPQQRCDVNINIEHNILDVEVILCSNSKQHSMGEGEDHLAMLGFGKAAHEQAGTVRWRA
jgi:hypothetical protein